MENLKNHKHIVDLFEMYENEFRVLQLDYDVLQLESAEIKLHFKNKLKVERKEKMALGKTIDELKKKLQRANSMSADKVTSVKVVSSSVVEAPGRNLEVNRSAEYQMLAAELHVEKKKQEVLSQKMTELNHQLQTERDLRARAEAKAGEAVGTADELLQKLEDNISDEPSVKTQILDAELKTKVELLHLEILELNQILQKEKELRAQAEADKFEAIKVAEALCKEAEDMQRVLKVSKRCSDNALQKLNTMEKSIENVANRYVEEKKEKDGLQQEIAELLQKQNDLRDQNETDSLRDFKILEAHCQELAELKRVSEEHSAKRQTLATRLEMEEKKQKGLCRDILWFIQMLEKEMEVKAKAETDKLEATEVGEALCQRIEKCKVCSKSQDKTRQDLPTEH